MCDKKIFYLDGIKNDELAIVEGSALYEFLSDNKDIIFEDGEEIIVISKQTLIDVEDAIDELTDAECVLLGYLDFHFEYNQGYIFK